MLKIYSEKAAERILQRHSADIEAIAARCSLPAACLRAILFKELTDIDILDPVADALVRFNQRRLAEPVFGGSFLQKCDSSTGYGQIFARVAIEAVNFAADRGVTDYAALGLPVDHRLDAKVMADLRLVWDRLHTDPVFNMTATALNLLAAAEEMTGRIDFSDFSPGELKLVFTRYNGNFKDVSPYGEAVYDIYQRYAAMESGPS